MNIVSGTRRPKVDYQTSQRKHKPDYWLLIITLMLMGIGLVVVYAISPGLSQTTNVGEQYYVSKQITAIAMGILAFGFLSFLPINRLRQFEKQIIWGAVGTSLAVRVFGEQVNGAYRWIQLGGISFQAVEFAKIAIIIWLASFLVTRIRLGELGDSQKTTQPILISLGLVAGIIAWVQSDLGSTFVIVVMMFLMILVSGMPIKRIAMIGAVAVIGVGLLVSTSGYRRERFATFLNPSKDCQNSGYQACQALIAVGSGGLFGLGLGKSVQAYGYLPEAANDSIFAIIAEKFGFVGAIFLCVLYLALFSRLKKIIEHTKDTFNRLVVIGVFAWLSTQTLVNIGAMIGLLPLKGITLPFVSYGGTSLMFSMGAIGIVFYISRFTSFAPVDDSDTNKSANKSGSYLAWKGNV